MSLSELTVALLLSSLLLLLTALTVSVSKAYYLQQLAIADIDQEQRLVHHILGRAIKLSGLVGCQSMNNSITVSRHDAAVIDISPQGVMQVGENGAELIVQHSSVLAADVLATASKDSNYLTVSAEPISFKENDLVVLSDCEHMDVMRLRKVVRHGKSQRLIWDRSLGTLSSDYNTLAQVSRWRAVKFYLAPSKYPDPNGNVITSLWRKDLISNNNEELIQGIDDMVILPAKLTTVKLLVRSLTTAGIPQQHLRWRSGLMDMHDGALHSIATFVIARRNSNA